MVQDLIAQLRDEDPDVRVKACILLRKEGDSAAIPELVRVYQQEDDLVVREAAADALRFFAQKEGASGGASSGLRNVAALLVISLVVLVALNVVTRMGGAEDETEPTQVVQQTEPSSRDALLNDYLEHWANALADVMALRAEWTAESLPCTAALVRPQELVVQDIDRQTYPDIAFVDEFNLALTTLEGVTADWDAVCASAEAAADEQRTAATGTLDSIEAILNNVGPAINEAMTNPAPTNPPPTVAATATVAASPTTAASLEPTALPTATPVPTLNPEVAPVVRDLDRIINNTETELNSLINNKWNFVQRGEVSPFGCAGSNLNDPYGDASEELLAEQPDLAAIILVLNDALTAAQASADLYATNCVGSSLTPTIIEQGLTQAQTALSNIELAKSELDRLYRQ